MVTTLGNGRNFRKQARILGIAEERALINWNYGAVDGSFSPGKGGGEDVKYRHKGKGFLIHTLTDELGRICCLQNQFWLYLGLIFV